MANITAQGSGGYSKACELIKEFKEVGIESGVTVGGIWLLLDEPRIQEAQEIVARHDWSLKGGCTDTMQIGIENMSIRNGDTHWMRSAKKSADAESVIQEWS